MSGLPSIPYSDPKFLVFLYSAFLYLSIELDSQYRWDELDCQGPILILFVGPDLHAHVRGTCGVPQAYSTGSAASHFRKVKK